MDGQALQPKAGSDIGKVICSQEARHQNGGLLSRHGELIWRGALESASVGIECPWLLSARLELEFGRVLLVGFR